MKILIVTHGRINKNDSNSNSMLLRNLFGDWKRNDLAQIYSSGSNGDDGFLGHYYCLGSKDRFMGALFFWIKSKFENENQGKMSDVIENNRRNKRDSFFDLAKKVIRKYIIDSGVYEYIFALRPSLGLREWVKNFEPDIILAQGYSITFTILPIYLSKELNCKIATFWSDDWPNYQYAGKHKESKWFSLIAGAHIRNLARRLIDAASFHFAFGYLMGDEYRKRYGKNFFILNHCDDPSRYLRDLKKHPNLKEFRLIVTGSINDHRFESLVELDAAVHRLNSAGLNIKIKLYSNITDSFKLSYIYSSNSIDLFNDPGNQDLPACLANSDLLVILESFDHEYALANHLSISSKSHIFMFARKPILVYGSNLIGTLKYASDFGWACCLSNREPSLLDDAVLTLLTDESKINSYIQAALKCGENFHTFNSNRLLFKSALLSNNSI